MHFNCHPEPVDGRPFSIKSWIRQAHLDKFYVPIRKSVSEDFNYNFTFSETLIILRR